MRLHLNQAFWVPNRTIAFSNILADLPPFAILFTTGSGLAKDGRMNLIKQKALENLPGLFVLQEISY